MQSKRFGCSCSSASSVDPTADDLDVVAAADQLDDRAALGLVVLDQQQALDPRSMNGRIAPTCR